MQAKTLQILAHTDMLMRRDCKMVFWITFVLLHMLLIFDVLGCFFEGGIPATLFLLLLHEENSTSKETKQH